MIRRPLIAVLILMGLCASLHADPAAPSDNSIPDPKSAPALDATVPADFVEHQAGDSGVTLRIPKDWIVIDPPPPTMKFMAFVNKTAFVNKDIDRVTVNITPYPPGGRIESVYPVVTRLHANDPKMYDSMQTDFVKLNGEPVIRLVYQNITNPNDLKRAIQFIFLKHDELYVLSFTAHEENYAALLPTFEQVAVSMQLPDHLPQGTHRSPKLNPKYVLSEPNAEDTAAQIKTIESNWQNAAGQPVDLLADMQGDCTRRPDGTVVLDRGQKIVSSASYTVPATFRIIALTKNNDVRIAYPADQIIFNWGMDPTQLRVDGGPANGHHKDGAGQLAPDKWVGIELIVRPDEMVIYVDGQERYRAAADFSKINKPLSITAHDGSMEIKSVKVIAGNG